MTREEAMKARGAVFDAALRVRKLGNAISEHDKREKSLREKYSQATTELSQLRKMADAAEAEAITEEARTAALIDAVEDIKA